MPWLQVCIINAIKRISYLPPFKRIHWVSFFENENEHSLVLLHHLCLCPVCTKRKFSPLLHRVIKRKTYCGLHCQTLAAPQLKAQFTTFYTITSDERYLEPTLHSASALQKLLSHHLVKVKTVSSWWSVCGVQSASLPPFTSLAGLTRKRPYQSREHRYFQGMLVSLCFLLFNNSGRWMGITALTQMYF